MSYNSIIYSWKVGKKQITSLNNSKLQQYSNSGERYNSLKQRLVIASTTEAMPGVGGSLCWGWEISGHQPWAELFQYLSPVPTLWKSETFCRVFGRFTLEAILAIAFGRRVDLQKGESDEFSKAMNTVITGFGDGEFEQFIMVNSKYMQH